MVVFKFVLEALIVLPLSLFFGCTSSKIIRDSEYSESVLSFKQGEYRFALQTFPRLEGAGFITSIEKNWIGFWSDKMDNSTLQHQILTLENRKFLSVSKEGEIFFFGEAEDGYVPGEHEVVLIHLLSAMAFIKEQKWESAKVEMRQANFYMQSIFNENQPHFDDPSLRIWSGSIWASLGQWDEAQVDFRKAAELSGSVELRKIAHLDSPPKELNLVFTGVGPELGWSKIRPEPDFKKNEQKPTLAGFSDGVFTTSKSTQMVSFSTFPWFQRHSERNHLIRDYLLKSKYMTESAGLIAMTTTKKTYAGTFAASMAVAGVALGLVVIGGTLYLVMKATEGGSSSNLGEVLVYGIGLGAAIGAAAIKGAQSLYTNASNEAELEEQKNFDQMKIYRFVRFMPNWISLVWSDEARLNRKRLKSSHDIKKIEISSNGEKNLFRDNLNRTGIQAPSSLTKLILIHDPN